MIYLYIDYQVNVKLQPIIKNVQNETYNRNKNLVNFTSVCFAVDVE